MRRQPNCQTVRALEIYGLPNANPGERNWEIENVDCTSTYVGDIDRARITVHWQLGQKYHLLLD
jgi:hypothetical protein